MMQKYELSQYPDDGPSMEPDDDGRYYLVSEADAVISGYKDDAERYRVLRDNGAYMPEECGVRGGVELDKLCDQFRIVAIAESDK